MSEPAPSRWSPLVSMAFGLMELALTLLVLVTAPIWLPLALLWAMGDPWRRR